MACICEDSNHWGKSTLESRCNKILEISHIYIIKFVLGLEKWAGTLGTSAPGGDIPNDGSKSSLGEMVEGKDFKKTKG